MKEGRFANGRGLVGKPSEGELYSQIASIRWPNCGIGWRLVGKVGVGMPTLGRPHANFSAAAASVGVQSESRPQKPTS